MASEGTTGGTGTANATGTGGTGGHDVTIDVANNLLILVPIVIAVYSGRVESVTGYVISLIAGVISFGYSLLTGGGKSVIGTVISILGLLVLILLWFTFDHTDADYPNSYEITTDPNSSIAKYNPREFRGNNVCFVLKNGPIDCD